MAKQTNIAEQIDILIKLQELDFQIYKLKAHRQAKPQELERLQADFEQNGLEVKALEDGWKSLQVKRKEKEIDLQSKEENVKKLEAQLYKVKTNKEYTALQKEIEGLKADDSVLEDEILQILEDADKVKIDLSKEKEELAAEEKNLKENQERIKQELDRIEKELGGLELKRESITPHIEKTILARYERILVNKYGLAMVAVENGACQGCHMNLPPQVINEIRMKDQIIICESCARILYIKDASNS